MSSARRSALPATLLGSLVALALAWGPLATTASAAENDTGGVTTASARAIFAGGCFWCMEADFEKLDGVHEAVSGYAGGHTQNPTYKSTSRGDTGHAEVVEIHYDPAVISYEALLAHFWKNVDPTTPNRQFCDSGSQYRAALMPRTEAERAAAATSLRRVKDSGRFDTVVVALEEPGTFWRAEEYHQDYYKKNPIRYRWYRSGCGRDQRLAELWGDAK